MPRKRKKSTTSSTGTFPILVTIAVILAIAVVAVIGYRFVFNKQINAPLMNIPTYIKSSTNLNGNIVKIYGAIKASDSLDNGETFLELTPNMNKHDIEPTQLVPIALYISKEVRDAHSGLNLDISASYKFIAKIDQQGHINVENIYTE